MFLPAPFTRQSIKVAVTAASATFGAPLDALAMNRDYLFVSNTNCWLKQSDAGTAATAASGSMLWPANTPLRISGNDGLKLSVIRDTADGSASLTPCVL